MGFLSFVENGYMLILLTSDSAVSKLVRSLFIGKCFWFLEMQAILG